MRSIRAATATILFLGVIGSAAPAWPWGDLGHKVVCELAFHELNTKARKEVTRLIRQDEEFRTFADSCVWPDHPKRREIEHYINVPRDFVQFTAAQCPAAAK